MKSIYVLNIIIGCVLLATIHKVRTQSEEIGQLQEQQNESVIQDSAQQEQIDAHADKLGKVAFIGADEIAYDKNGYMYSKYTPGGQNLALYE